MEQQNYSLDFIELIGLVKELNTGIASVKDTLASLKLDVNVEAPNIKVEPTPITVNEREIPKELKAEITNLPDIDKFVKAIKEALAKPSVVSNLKGAKADTKKIEELLAKLLKQKAVVEVKVEPDITLPYGTNPKAYIPVRLTDGTQFYNAVNRVVSALNTVKWNINYKVSPYFGYISTDGNWLFKKVLDSSVSYATVINNPSVKSYADALDNRAGLVYGRSDEAGVL